VLLSITPSFIMVETDCPYLLPRSLRPLPKDRRNEPAFLPHIVEEPARDRDEDVAVTAAATTAAAQEFFGLAALG
jgi:TatD DNase family protein